MTSGRRAAWLLALAAAAAGGACGKRGTPIAPPVRMPAPVDTIAASRLGDDIYITLTVPATNIDKSIPIDIERIDVYGYTGRLAPSLARFADVGTVVASIPVAPPPKPGAPAPPPSVPPDLSSGAPIGTAVTVRDRLTPDEFEQGPVPVDPRRREPAPPLPAAAAPMPLVMRRFYVAVPFNRRGRPGPPGMQAQVALTTLPDPPADVRVSYGSAAIALAWEPAGGLLGFLLDRILPPEPTPFVAAVLPVAVGAAPPPGDAAVPAGPMTYNVYLEIAPDPLVLPLASPLPPWAAQKPLPVNPAPLAALAATDVLTAGRRHCYTVRAQRGEVSSVASPPACVTPIDIFPPAAPGGLAAVPSEGGISLIWEPNSELDLGGYLVLRREPGDATLRQLTATPVADVRYRDTDVQPGRRYVYSVVALDTQVPLPNVSAESERVEETAR
ncbi:MAG: fibronectin type III domain-containing protein [Acidobacteria bacterium]|nr:fibronectin type III domain-containing protein [Acidobacteriota bacterium]